MSKLRRLAILAVVSVHGMAFACPNGVPYAPQSALAGAGFTTLQAPSELPPGWDLYNFQGVSAPIPVQLAKRIVLLEEEGWVRQIYILDAEPPLLWSIHTSAIEENQSVVGLSLLRRAVATDISFDEKLEKEECVEIVTALMMLDLISPKAATAAYDLGSAIALHGKRASEDIIDVYWQSSDDELIIASWWLSPEESAILHHFNADSRHKSNDDPFQTLLDCVERSPATACGDIVMPGIPIEFRAGLFPEPSQK